jgi:hypothetical protein
MINLIKNLFKNEKQRYSLVMSIPYPVTIGGKKCIIYYHLYESNIGNRSMECTCTNANIDARDYVKCTTLYNEKIHRWLEGRYDPEIPAYSELSQEDVMNKLRGKISK